MVDTPSRPRAMTDTIVVTLPAEIDIANADQVAGPGEVRHMLTLLGLDTVLAIYPSLPEALPVEPRAGAMSHRQRRYLAGQRQRRPLGQVAPLVPVGGAAVRRGCG